MFDDQHERRVRNDERDYMSRLRDLEMQQAEERAREIAHIPEGTPRPLPPKGDECFTREDLMREEYQHDAWQGAFDYDNEQYDYTEVYDDVA